MPAGLKMLTRALAVLVTLSPVLALDAPGQPTRKNAPLGEYETVGNSLVSAQQVRRSHPVLVLGSG